MRRVVITLMYALQCEGRERGEKNAHFPFGLVNLTSGCHCESLRYKMDEMEYFFYSSMHFIYYYLFTDSVCM